jgi:hypothetical protein
VSTFCFGQEQSLLEDVLYSLPKVPQLPMLCSNLLELTLEGGFAGYAHPAPRLHCGPG